jgi:L-ascorbate metabolism protein UlaG (beta-lactamase superfamily)
MRLTYYGHSCFLVETSKARIILDPFLNDNPVAPIKAKDVKCEYVVLSHGHEDHSGDALEIAKRCEATLIANYEIAEYFGAKGAKTHGMNPGGGFNFPFGRIKLTLAHHTSSVEAGLKPVYLGVPCGILLQADGKTLYHAGDTALFLDMQLIGRAGLDVALLPIGDNFTMGPDGCSHRARLPETEGHGSDSLQHVAGNRAGCLCVRAQAAKQGQTVRVMKAGETVDV